LKAFVQTRRNALTEKVKLRSLQKGTLLYAAVRENARTEEENFQVY